MHRLFVALDLPEEVRQAVCTLKEELRGFRWVPEAQLHLTLRFIGDSDDATLELLKEELGKICSPSFDLGLNGIGHFPPRGLPRILWVGIASGPELVTLQTAVEQACIAAGVVPEERGFSPHLTIARLKETLPEVVGRFEANHSGFRCGPFWVEAFHLYASSLTPQGAIHQRLATVALA
jgi:2'-5' RNA ligase